MPSISFSKSLLESLPIPWNVTIWILPLWVWRGAISPYLVAWSQYKTSTTIAFMFGLITDPFSAATPSFSVVFLFTCVIDTLNPLRSKAGRMCDGVSISLISWLCRGKMVCGWVTELTLCLMGHHPFPSSLLILYFSSVCAGWALWQTSLRSAKSSRHGDPLQSKYFSAVEEFSGGTSWGQGLWAFDFWSVLCVSLSAAGKVSVLYKYH